MDAHTATAAATTATGEVKNVKFGGDMAFHRDLKARVARYFAMTGRSQRDCPQMYLKTAIIMAWAAASYVLLVFFATSWWMAVPLGISLGLAVTAIGFNIQHDGGHRAYSKHKWINRVMASTMDLAGGSSFIWDHKHNTLHHTYANIADHDDDIDVGIFGRLSPEQKRLGFHRYQHIYLWFLYGLLSVKWQLFDDFYNLARGRIGTHKFARPKGLNLAIFIGGKVLFFSLVFVIPLLLHPWWVVLMAYILVSGMQGVILSVVFQLAHVVEHADFPVPDEETGRMETDWAVHQVETTVDFSRTNPIITWYCGGLNFQVEHHLFPRICHIHYPKLSRIVEKTCKRHGIQYNNHGSFFSGVASHFRWLRTMGRPAA